jgi:hypothetical protein
MKYLIGDVVYLMGNRVTVTEARHLSGIGWVYYVEHPTKPFWACAQWHERMLVSEVDWLARQAEIARGIEQRRRENEETLAHLEAIEPVRGLFDTDEDFQFAYCQWAESFWGVGDMPYVVRRLYNQYMVGNQWTIAKS